MNDSGKSTIKIISIGIGVGMILGSLVGFIAGTFDLPMAVIIPAVVVPITFGAVIYLKKGA